MFFGLAKGGFCKVFVSVPLGCLKKPHHFASACPPIWSAPAPVSETGSMKPSVPARDFLSQ